MVNVLIYITTLVCEEIVSIIRKYHYHKLQTNQWHREEEPTINIYILSVVALDETNIYGCLHFSMQNIEMSCDLDRASKRSNVNVSQ